MRVGVAAAQVSVGDTMLTAQAEGDGVPVATRMRDVRFKRMVRPGETMTLEVTLDEKVSQAFFLTARVTVADELAMRMQFACTLTEVADQPQHTEKAT